VQTPTSTDQIGQKAAAAIDDKREAVARGIDAAASSLHAKAESLPGGEKVARATHSAAVTMEKVAGYVRDQDVKSMLSDIQQIVKRHPGATLATAAALGFLLARSISRN
jgi:hypothetical protein